MSNAPRRSRGRRGSGTARGRVWVPLHTERFYTRRQAVSRGWYLKRDRRYRTQLTVQLKDRIRPARPGLTSLEVEC